MPWHPTDLDDRSLAHLLDALTDSGQAISIYDADDCLRYANKTYWDIFIKDFEGSYSFSDILRYGARQGIGVKVDGGDVEALIARTYLRRRSDTRKSFETDLLDGRWFWMDQTTLANGWVLTVGADITALKHNEKTLRHAHEEALLASRTDPLTGLANRRHILELLDESLAANKLSGAGLCLAVIDLDYFKSVNDTYGHDAGDVVLQHFADGCADRLPQGRLGRMGGEEFLILLPDARLNDAVRIVEDIRGSLPPVKLIEGALDLPYTFSAGVTEALPHDDRTTILYRADRALYDAKAAGRNCSRFSFERDLLP
ncbi:sensor domain-containing diguanylate cyclase [Microvirga pudoricolor]|uniref:sensor domain-containing diguanylate cyclase n=1 Tax=Microvirga pudoricolor TaxID=2778729 RepID=UPI0019505362|nr:sensor domain-containing diguanylate cyclase [Microvirga pudoricolor]MBM6594392.1 diguanylate cyclase [Microvirga pudoricolor]